MKLNLIELILNKNWHNKLSYTDKVNPADLIKMI